MSYATNLDTPGVKSEFLAVLTPKIRCADSWTLHSGSVYRQSFTAGYVSRVDIDGVELDAGSSETLSAGEFFYDPTLERLYIRMSDSSNPTGNFVVAYWNYYAATFDKKWYRDPLDSATTEIYWRPVIIDSPSLVQSSSDVIFGYLPQQSASITLNNADHFWEEFIYDSSFNLAPIKVYHLVGTLSVANIKLVYSGYMSNVTYSPSTISIQCFDRVDVLNQEFRHDGSDASFFGTSTFPNLDPSFSAYAIRRIYGRVNGVVPVNIDYVNESPTTSDNRDWVVCNDHADLVKTASYTCAASGGVGPTANSTTQTFLTTDPNSGSGNEASQLEPGDSLFFDRVAGTDESQRIRTDFLISDDGNNIRHTALASPMAAGDTVTRSWITGVFIIQQGVLYRALYIRDYTNADFGDNTTGFSFTTTMEANLGMPATLSPGDKVFCNVVGIPDVTAAQIIVDMLEKSGIESADIDDTTILAQEPFPSLNKVSMSIPANVGDSFPLYKDIVLMMLQTLIAKLFIDADGLWSVLRYDTDGAGSYSASDIDIRADSILYEFNYDEVLSSLIISYFYAEILENTSQQPGFLYETSSSTTAEYLHQVSKSKTIQIVYRSSFSASTVAGEYMSLFGDRFGRMRITSGKKYFNSTIGDVVEIDRTRLPGFAYDSDTSRQRNFSVLSVIKTVDGVELLLDDQKGVP